MVLLQLLITGSITSASRVVAAIKGMPQRLYVNLETRGDRNAQTEDQVERQEALSTNGERQSPRWLRF